MGLVAARHKGVAAASGKTIVFIDADDFFFEPTSLATVY